MPGTYAIRAGIALLALFAFALSYDALQQMAIAIHVRGLLTYTFPLVIDGFIAIGVGVLLMLRTAPARSRVYVWTLVGAATATSIWANAPHAVRLNQQARQGDGLRLDDLPVGALSAIAPLALAGAVHLYIVIRRHPTPRAQEPEATRRHNTAGDARAASPTGAIRHVPEPTATDVAPRPADTAPQPGAPHPAKNTDVPHPGATAQRPEHAPVSPERLALARTAPRGRNGRASRRHIEDTFRDKGLTIGRKEADQLKDTLQAELDEAAPQREETGTAPVGTA
ncbi:DUF2637 domain-containing protein [Streptomyces daliensis]|uniref:DUF2637 domain-containing protein n=1 Tax=Streptomyces daliensis TaxID=299421 RepID=A0A8T4J1S3_9ACTN|nr:DUF2637 domain-containing protein [Streptomyces daliensis]